MINAPVLHVNGDFPEEVARAMEIAFKYRNFFRKVIPFASFAHLAQRLLGYHCRSYHLSSLVRPRITVWYFIDVIQGTQRT